MHGRSPHPGFPPVRHSGGLSAVWVFSEFISNPSWVHYYISQDPLQLGYRVTEFRSMNCVGRSDMNGFQDYSHKITPRGPYFSFPVCQVDAEDSAETFRDP